MQLTFRVAVVERNAVHFDQNLSFLQPSGVWGRSINQLDILKPILIGDPLLHVAELL